MASAALCEEKRLLSTIAKLSSLEAAGASAGISKEWKIRVSPLFQLSVVSVKSAWASSPSFGLSSLSVRGSLTPCER